MANAPIELKAFIPSSLGLIVVGGANPVKDIHGSLDRIIGIVCEVAETGSNSDVVLSHAEDNILIGSNLLLEIHNKVPEVLDKLDFLGLQTIVVDE